MKTQVDKFIEKARKVHGDKYDYSNFIYVDSQTNGIIICPIHGEFHQKPANHLRNKCPKCSSNLKLNNITFIEKARKVHGDKYDYSKVNYKNASTKINIICQIHGQFSQIAYGHLHGYGCPKCSNNNKLSTNEFIEKARKVHGDKYDYSKVIYKNARYKIEIICPIHGSFLQEPANHINGQNCGLCGINISAIKKTYNNEVFIEKARKVHGDKYDYSKVNYNKSNKPIEIVCSKHGSFFQKPNYHLTGRGCDRCSESKGETIILNYLKNMNIKYIREHRFHDCKNKKPLPFDFYLPEKNMCIEFDGIHHFKCVGGWTSKDKFLITINHDKIKNNYCLSKNIRLLRISYVDINNINEILKNNI